MKKSNLFPESQFRILAAVLGLIVWFGSALAQAQRYQVGDVVQDFTP